MAIFNSITQVSIVTGDFDGTIDRLCNHFGIGPFKCWTHKSPALFDTRLRGKEALWTMKFGIAWIGAVQLGVVQPLDGDSLYSEFLAKRGGAGIHHLLVCSEYSYDQGLKQFEALGFPAAQSAALNLPLKNGRISVPRMPQFLAKRMATRFSYFETEALAGTVLERSKLPPGLSLRAGTRLGKGDYIYPATFTDVNERVTNGIMTDICKVGIVVNDAPAMSQSYAEKLGITGWTIADSGPRLADLKVNGQPATFNQKVASTTLGNIRLELIQPTQGDSPYSAWLAKHGPGIHHIGVRTAAHPFENVIAHLNNTEVPIAMEGRIASGPRFLQFDTGVGLVVEVMSA